MEPTHAAFFVDRHSEILSEHVLLRHSNPKHFIVSGHGGVANEATVAIGHILVDSPDACFSVSNTATLSANEERHENDAGPQRVPFDRMALLEGKHFWLMPPKQTVGGHVEQFWVAVTYVEASATDDLFPASAKSIKPDAWRRVTVELKNPFVRRTMNTLARSQFNEWLYSGLGLATHHTSWTVSGVVISHSDAHAANRHDFVFCWTVCIPTDCVFDQGSIKARYSMSETTLRVKAHMQFLFAHLSHMGATSQEVPYPNTPASGDAQPMPRPCGCFHCDTRLCGLMSTDPSLRSLQKLLQRGEHAPNPNALSPYCRSDDFRKSHQPGEHQLPIDDLDSLRQPDEGAPPGRYYMYNRRHGAKREDHPLYPHQITSVEWMEFECSKRVLGEEAFIPSIYFSRFGPQGALWIDLRTLDVYREPLRVHPGFVTNGNESGGGKTVEAVALIVLDLNRMNRESVRSHRVTTTERRSVGRAGSSSSSTSTAVSSIQLTQASASASASASATTATMNVVARKSLIIAHTDVMCDQWISQIHMLSNLKACILPHGTKCDNFSQFDTESLPRWEDYDVFVVSLHGFAFGLPRFQRGGLFCTLESVHLRYIFVDECQMLPDPNTNTWINLCKLQCDRRILQSATMVGEQNDVLANADIDALELPLVFLQCQAFTHTTFSMTKTLWNQGRYAGIATMFHWMHNNVIRHRHEQMEGFPRVQRQLHTPALHKSHATLYDVAMTVIRQSRMRCHGWRECPTSKWIGAEDLIMCKKVWDNIDAALAYRPLHLYDERQQTPASHRRIIEQKLRTARPDMSMVELGALLNAIRPMRTDGLFDTVSCSGCNRMTPIPITLPCCAHSFCVDCAEEANLFPFWPEVRVNFPPLEEQQQPQQPQQSQESESQRFQRWLESKETRLPCPLQDCGHTYELGDLHMMLPYYGMDSNDISKNQGNEQEVLRDTVSTHSVQCKAVIRFMKEALLSSVHNNVVIASLNPHDAYPLASEAEHQRLAFARVAQDGQFSFMERGLKQSNHSRVVMMADATRRFAMSAKVQRNGDDPTTTTYFDPEHRTVGPGGRVEDQVKVDEAKANEVNTDATPTGTSSTLNDVATMEVAQEEFNHAEGIHHLKQEQSLSSGSTSSHGFESLLAASIAAATLPIAASVESNLTSVFWIKGLHEVNDIKETDILSALVDTDMQFDSTIRTIKINVSVPNHSGWISVPALPENHQEPLFWNSATGASQKVYLFQQDGSELIDITRPFIRSQLRGILRQLKFAPAPLELPDQTTTAETTGVSLPTKASTTSTQPAFLTDRDAVTPPRSLDIRVEITIIDWVEIESGSVSSSVAPSKFSPAKKNTKKDKKRGGAKRQSGCVITIPVRVFQTCPVARRCIWIHDSRVIGLDWPHGSLFISLGWIQNAATRAQLENRIFRINTVHNLIRMITVVGAGTIPMRMALLFGGNWHAQTGTDNDGDTTIPDVLRPPSHWTLRCIQDEIGQPLQHILLDQHDSFSPDNDEEQKEEDAGLHHNCQGDVTFPTDATGQLSAFRVLFRSFMQARQQATGATRFVGRSATREDGNDTMTAMMSTTSSFEGDIVHGRKRTRQSGAPGAPINDPHTKRTKTGRSVRALDAALTGKARDIERNFFMLLFATLVSPRQQSKLVSKTHGLNSAATRALTTSSVSALESSAITSAISSTPRNQPENTQELEKFHSEDSYIMDDGELYLMHAMTSDHVLQTPERTLTTSQKEPRAATSKLSGIPTLPQFPPRMALVSSTPPGLASCHVLPQASAVSHHASSSTPIPSALVQQLSPIEGITEATQICAVCGGNDSTVGACTDCSDKTYCGKCFVTWHRGSKRQTHARWRLVSYAPTVSCFLDDTHAASVHCVECKLDFCRACETETHGISAPSRMQSHTVQRITTHGEVKRVPLPNPFVSSQVSLHSSSSIPPVLPALSVLPTSFQTPRGVKPQTSTSFQSQAHSFPVIPRLPQHIRTNPSDSATMAQLMLPVFSNGVATMSAFTDEAASVAEHENSPMPNHPVNYIPSLALRFGWAQSSNEEPMYAYRANDQWETMIQLINNVGHVVTGERLQLDVSLMLDTEDELPVIFRRTSQQGNTSSNNLVLIPSEPFIDPNTGTSTFRFHVNLLHVHVRHHAPLSRGFKLCVRVINTRQVVQHVFSPTFDVRSKPGSK